MSEDVLHTGKLIPVKMLQDETIDELAYRILKENNTNPDLTCYDSFIEQLDDEFYQKYVIVDDVIYEVQLKSSSIYDDIFEGDKNSDGTIDFIVKYYNGGCSFNEAIETVLEKVK